MRQMRMFLARLGGMLSKARLDRELDEEVRFHLEMQTEENVRRGMSPEEARYAARRAFGGVEQVKEACRERRGFPMIETILGDMGYGLRLLRRNPGFTAAAVLTLAVGIGANTAIFSVVNAVLLRPLPYPGSDRLVVLYNSYRKIAPDLATYGYCCNSAPDYFDRKEETEIFESLALLDFVEYGVGAEGSPQRVTGLRVTPSFFAVLGTSPRLGRAFTEAEAVPGNERIAILGHDLWRRMFGGSAAVLGQSIRIDGVPHEIVGVMPEGFDVLSRGSGLFLPLAFSDEQKTGRHSNFAFMLARLRPGVGLEAARERMRALDARNLERFPGLAGFVERTGFATFVNDLHDEMVRTVRPGLRLLQAGSAFMLLIGCVNIAILLLIRVAGRRQELAVRLAIGAGRTRVTRQLLTESLLLGILGGASGLIVGIGAAALLVRLGLGGPPAGGGVGIDATVVAFTLLTAVATCAVFGAIPAVHASRVNLAEVLRQSGRGGSTGRSASAARGALVVAEVSLTFVLLIGAGLMAASFRHVLWIDPGFGAGQVLTARFTLPAARYGRDDAVRTFAARVQEALGALPGVRSAGITTLLPFSGVVNKSTVTVEGHVPAEGEPVPTPHNSWVTGGYFAAMGIPLLAGRSFEDGDDASAPQVAIVDREFAERYWPGESPIGKRIHRGTGSGRWMSVVGLVDAVRMDDLAERERRGAVYFAHSQPAPDKYLPLRRDMSLAVRSDMPGALLAREIEAAILKLDPELPLYDLETMEARLADSMTGRRTPMTLLLVFAGVALLLSVIGIYGVLAHSVSQRTKEIGIRMALGAKPASVLKQVLWQGLRPALLGLAVGVVCALWLTRMIAGMLYGVEPADPYVFGLVAGLLALSALAACWVPARRARRLDVVTTLRCE